MVLVILINTFTPWNNIMSDEDQDVDIGKVRLWLRSTIGKMTIYTTFGVSVIGLISGYLSLGGPVPASEAHVEMHVDSEIEAFEQKIEPRLQKADNADLYLKIKESEYWRAQVNILQSKLRANPGDVETAEELAKAQVTLDGINVKIKQIYEAQKPQG